MKHILQDNGFFGNIFAKMQFSEYVKGQPNYYFISTENELISIKLDSTGSFSLIIENVRNGWASDLKYCRNTHTLSYTWNDHKYSHNALVISETQYTLEINAMHDRAASLKKLEWLSNITNMLGATSISNHITTYEELVNLTLPKFIHLFPVKGDGVSLYDGGNTYVIENFEKFKYVVKGIEVSYLSPEWATRFINDYVSICTTALKDESQPNMLNEISAILKKYQGQ